MLVRRPLEFGRIGVSGTDVFGLQMLKLAMNIVPFTHFVIYQLKFIIYLDIF